MKMTHQVTMENKQMLSQTQIQSLEILAMDAVELEEFLQNEFMSNPMLEHKASHDMHTSTSAEASPNWYENCTQAGTMWKSGMRIRGSGED